MLLAGCVATPSHRTLRLPALSLSVVGSGAVIDERAEFRAEFCDALQRSGAAARRGRCADYLWRLPDERPLARDWTAAHPGPLRARVLVVGGAFDCFPPASTPFAGSVAELRSPDLSIDYVAVSGRSSSRANAAIIDARIEALDPQDDRPLILLGYSKGTVDILEALTRYPAIVHRVTAVVSVAGAVNGSALAERYRRLYDFWLEKRHLASCPRGDGGVLDSLTPTRRLSWLATHRLPKRIRYYSLATFVTPPGLARMLREPYRILSRIDARNDGQLLAYDEIIPGSILLGYANADHWAVATHLEDRFPFLAHRAIGRHPFPQRALLEALLRFVLTSDARHHDLSPPTAPPRRAPPQLRRAPVPGTGDLPSQ
jgi:hypothetical protein